MTFVVELVESVYAVKSVDGVAGMLMENREEVIEKGFRIMREYGDAMEKLMKLLEVMRGIDPRTTATIVVVEIGKWEINKETIVCNDITAQCVDNVCEIDFDNNERRLIMRIWRKYMKERAAEVDSDFDIPYTFRSTLSAFLTCFNKTSFDGIMRILQAKVEKAMRATSFDVVNSKEAKRRVDALASLMGVRI